MYEGKACKGTIQEISINIVDGWVEDGDDYITVKISYRIGKNRWIKENNLYDDLNFFNKYVNKTND